jgi:hypothetical protein
MLAVFLAVKFGVDGGTGADQVKAEGAIGVADVGLSPSPELDPKRRFPTPGRMEAPYSAAYSGWLPSSVQ